MCITVGCRVAAPPVQAACLSGIAAFRKGGALYALFPIVWHRGHSRKSILLKGQMEKRRQELKNIVDIGEEKDCGRERRDKV